MQQWWITVGVTVLIQVVGFAVAFGMIRNEVKNLREKVGDLSERLDTFDEVTRKHTARIENALTRLQQVERQASDISEMKDKLLTFMGAAQERDKNTSATLATLTRGLEGVQRQLANVANLKSGVIHELHGGGQ